VAPTLPQHSQSVVGNVSPDFSDGRDVLFDKGMQLAACQDSAPQGKRFKLQLSATVALQVVDL